jgi:hypothetical protein
MQVWDRVGPPSLLLQVLGGADVPLQLLCNLLLLLLTIAGSNSSETLENIKGHAHHKTGEYVHRRGGLHRPTSNFANSTASDGSSQNRCRVTPLILYSPFAHLGLLACVFWEGVPPPLYLPNHCTIRDSETSSVTHFALRIHISGQI